MPYKFIRYCCGCCWNRTHVINEDDKKISIKNSTNATSNSSSGNPRNKCALQPGHSLMDWIRLGASGKDLTGIGENAGRLSVTRTELAKHNKKSNAWLAIRGKVYNVTYYLPFHPGGEEELMQGVGKDATNLFDEVHPWVNYEQILQKCFIGRLVAIDPNLDVESLFFDKAPNEQSTTNQEITETEIVVNDERPTEPQESAINNDEMDKQEEPILVLPRFDWIQKLDLITIIFYTKAFSNPLIELQHNRGGNIVEIFLTYDKQLFKNEIIFYREIEWSTCEILRTLETGKIELKFKKIHQHIWDNYGVLKQINKSINNVNILNDFKQNYVITNKLKINYNTFLIELERNDNSKIILPIGKHIRAFATLQGIAISRSYTPVPKSFFTYFNSTSTTCNHSTNNCLYLLIKRYPNGQISKYICDLETGDSLYLSKPLGDFELKELEKREIFLLLAAGTGITPMLSIIQFLLERRMRKCRQIRLLFFNKSRKDILLNNQLDALQKDDNRFKIQNILSEPDPDWIGLKGHINEPLLKDTLTDYLKDTGYSQRDIYVMVCGPNAFSEITKQLLIKMEFKTDQIHLFLG